MAGGLRRTVLAAVVATVALAAPAAALAGGTEPSAAAVYVEQPSSPGGFQAGTGGAAGLPSWAGKPSVRAAERCVQRAHTSTSAKLCQRLGSPALGAAGGLRATGSSGGPGTFGAAWDLGFGPTALLVLLLASFAAAIGRDGWRVWRRRGVAVP